MIQPINLTSEQLQVIPFKADDLERYDDMTGEIYEIFTDERTLQFLPEKRLYSLEDAEQWMKGAILNFHTGRSYVHFVRSKSSGRLLGMIDILSPAMAREHYFLSNYPWFIEFYLKGDAQGHSLMSVILPEVIDHIRSQGIDKIGAVVNRKNKAARRVLEKTGFLYNSPFDLLQDLYEYAV